MSYRVLSHRMQVCAMHEHRLNDVSSLKYRARKVQLRAVESCASPETSPVMCRSKWLDTIRFIFLVGYGMKFFSS